LLADEWSKAKPNGRFLVANALENWTDMDWFAHRFIFLKKHPGEGLEELKARIRRFMQDPARQAIIATKRAYRAALVQQQDGDRMDTSVSQHKKDSATLSSITKTFINWVYEFPKVTVGVAAILIAGIAYLVGVGIIQAKSRG